MSFHPQTPQSPSQFSSGTSDPVSSVATSMMAASTATTLPTPAHSVNGSASQLDAIMADDSPHKRKRSVDDSYSGDHEQKKIHLEESKLGIEDLHLDVGKKYLLCQTPHLESLPRASEDLYEMFNLASLAAEVAREKPNGEKNALRKTYKGHIKRLGVAGHFDVSKKKEDAPSEFMAMLQVPDLEWNVHQVKGREITDGLSDITLASLGRAVTMGKGPIPKSLWDTSVLGDMTPSNGDFKQTSSARPTAPNTPLTGAPGAMNRLKPQGPPGSDPTRPRRNIKKRTYGDSSYEGYGEGFPDDDAGVEAGYSTGEGEGGQKRRKKNPGNASPYPSAMRQQSYGPGMVGA
ncbi:Rox3 mediator complex subunit-domain-containing protein [Dactylonectria macrodidyma]|uniref:Mediator of RNA polymerase II transcription subunit 19 n=1 Tax=Dactylonectria macrodidyma TaxID=307937 RepID=A0A9P9FMS2_9HYPO|nr:Rox3 mediator complex subunit-domain-containing protein [Dactylonectria macrodidyma]